jgi:hypothetical protein
MSEQVPAEKENSAMLSQPTQQSSPLFEQPPFIEARPETFGKNSNISKELQGIQLKTIRRSLNWQNITVEAPFRSNENSLPSGTQPQQEQPVPAPAIEPQLLAKEQKKSEEASNPAISTDEGSPQPIIDGDNLDWQNTEEAEIQMKSGVQRASDGSTQASSSIESRLANSKGGGSALSDDARSFMECHFDADFGGIKVHTNSKAVQMNKELGAQAFTDGSNIYYGARKSPGKNELTVHELTHTIPQGAAVQMNKEVQRQLHQEEKKERLQAKEIPFAREEKSLQKTFFNKESSFNASGPQYKTLAAKELPSHNTVLSHNKELLQKTLDAEQQETQEKLIQAKQFTNSC